MVCFCRPDLAVTEWRPSMLAQLISRALLALDAVDLDMSLIVPAQLELANGTPKSFTAAQSQVMRTGSQDRGVAMLRSRRLQVYPYWHRV